MWSDRMFSPRRVLVIVVLTVVTAWALGWLSNPTPTPAQAHTFEQACTARTIPCAP